MIANCICVFRVFGAGLMEMNVNSRISRMAGFKLTLLMEGETSLESPSETNRETRKLNTDAFNEKSSPSVY